MNRESSLISLLLRQFSFTAAKGTLEGGRTYEKDTEIGGGGVEATDTNCTRTPMENRLTKGEGHSVMNKQSSLNFSGAILLEQKLKNKIKFIDGILDLDISML